MKQFRAFFAFLLLAFIVYVPLRAQNNLDKGVWHQVDSLVKKQYYSQAYEAATKIYNNAINEHNSRQSLIGARWLSIIENEYQENAADSSLVRFQRLLPTLDPVDQSICRLFLADFYFSYYRNNNWRINNNKPTDETDLDYKMWDVERYRKTIYGLIREAFSDVSLLQNTPVESLGELVINSDGKDGDLMPTMYDVAMYTVVNKRNSALFSKLQTFDFKQLELLYAEADRFVKMKIDSKKDTTKEYARFVLGLMQEWERFRSERESAGMMMALYCNRLDKLYTAVNISNDAEKEYAIKEMPKVIDYYRKSQDDHITMLYYKLAQFYNNAGRKVDAVSVIDTAISLFPESPGAIDCYNMKQGILAKNIQLDITDVSPSERHQLAKIKTLNVDRVYFRVIKDFDFRWIEDNEAKKKLRSQKVLKQWSQDIDIKKKYDYHNTYIVVPPMPQGKYMLLASSDAEFKDDGIAFTDFAVEDVAIVPMHGDKEGTGFLVDRVSGKPIANQTVRLRTRESYNGKWRVKLEEKTDKNGYFDFSSFFSLIDSWITYYSVSTIYNGYEIEGGQMYNYSYSSKSNATRTGNRIFFDRPVYKPGDTVRFAFLMYEKDRKVGAVKGNRDVLIYVKDINQVVDTLRLKTDEFGECEGRYILSADAMPGLWRILVRGEINDDYSFKVEAYKQPKYIVTLSKSKQERRFGETAIVEGVAASYTAVPISGAKVEYSVKRSSKLPRWRWDWRNYYDVYSIESKIVASGEVTTDEKGLFKIEFVPTPDSSIDITRKPCFDYVVTAKVTDINGETHEATTSLAVGYENSYINIVKKYNSRDDVGLVVSRCNLDGSAIDGRLNFEVYRLQQPGNPKLTPVIMQYNSEIVMPLTRSEFEKLFPLYDYDGSVSNYEKWPEQKKVYNATVNVTADNPYKYDMKGLKEGYYKFVATIITEEGDTLRNQDYVVYEPSTATKPIVSKLVSVNIDKGRCEVGDTLHLQIGSAYKDVDVFVVLSKLDSIFFIQKVNVNANYVKLAVPVTETMLGGIKFDFAAMKDNCFFHDEEGVEVLYSHKDLDVTFETFRNKLEPGDKERWTIRIKEKKSGLAAKVNLVATMYDHSLDTYGRLEYGFNPWIQQFASAKFSGINSHEMGYYYFKSPLACKDNKTYKYTTHYLNSIYFNDLERIVAAVAGVGYGTARGEDGMVTQLGNVRRRAGAKGFVSEDVEVVNELAIVDNDAEDEEEVFFLTDNSSDKQQSVVVKAQKVPVIEVGTPESGRLLSDGDITESAETPYIRQNLKTLAFFQPTLRSDDSGTVSISFTAPDLLTEWSILGTAWTKDLKVGSLSASAITQKRLMVVPNVPRFLRQGDTCIFSAKVSNLDVKMQNITVTLTLTENEGRRMGNEEHRTVVLEPNTSGEVHFTIIVPEDIYLLNYKIVASGQGCSDGEQAPIPILPNRQLVTESMAFYINGKGVKQYELTHLTKLTQSNDNTLTHSSLTVDITPNPIWLAIQSLPYVERQKNPSNIYLANAIYTNTLAFDIVQNNPQIEQLFAKWRQYGSDAFQSELDRNSDLKQTVMEETPWLQDAKDEEQRHREIAHYFDKVCLKSQLSTLNSKLVKSQRSDGGWSWIDGGRYTSLYTTQYILKTLGQLQQQGVKIDSKTTVALNRALEYVDRETYQYYKKYIKGKGYDVVNLDYLYIRSLYPDNHLSKHYQEAYDFFYNNAKKYNEEYRELYTQAMLSFLFHRNGDTKLAKDIVKRIKQKALYNDEMGMYWRDNRAGWLWNQRPIETQAMLIRAFAEVLGDNESVAAMQQWLLKQKQTTNWNTDVATVNAIQALLVTGNGERRTENNSEIKIHNSELKVQFGTNELKTDTTEARLHISQRLNRDEITPADGHLTITKTDDGIAWGAMYWQYFEQVDKIPASSIGVTLKRTLYKVESGNRFSVIRFPSSVLKVGDKLRVRIEIICDRTLEYLELKDPRCAALEPVSTASGWNWSSGLSYYVAVTNAAQTLYIDRLEKGKYVVEYDLYVNNAGTYTTAPTTIQCLYAPEFRALTPAEKLVIEN